MERGEGTTVGHAPNHVRGRSLAIQSRQISNGRTEFAAVGREIRKLIQAIKDAVPALSIKDELLSLESRKAQLQSRLEAPEMPELLHPRMADVYREKV